MPNAYFHMIYHLNCEWGITNIILKKHVMSGTSMDNYSVGLYVPNQLDMIGPDTTPLQIEEIVKHKSKLGKNQKVLLI